MAELRERQESVKTSVGRFLILMCLLLATIKVLGCHRTLPAPRNVILITVDTLRADHLGCYGYGPAQTRHFDELAGQGVMFANATSAVPLTLPSHSTIMTGVYPLAHGVRDNGGYYLDDRWQTLPETLKAGGFHTGGFVSAFVLDRRWGIAQGFEEYFDHFELSKYKMVSLDSVQRRGDETLNQALSWIDHVKHERFFAWIHFYDPHSPYDPPEPFRTEFNHPPFGLYDGEIAFTDTLIGNIRDYLAREKLLDTTMIVLTADHGEGLGDHREDGHGFFIYDSTTHIPLIIRLPGQTHHVVSDQVRTIDLYPTICDAVGVSVPAAVEGKSLLPLVEGKTLADKLSAYSESYYAKFHYGWSELKSLRTPEYKYIEAPRNEFYRLSGDSRERDNQYRAGDQRIELFADQLTKLVAQFAEAAAPRAVDEDAMEKLHALGYIGSFVSPQQTSGEKGADPKDKIDLYNRVKIAQGQSAEGKSDQAFAGIQSVIADDPQILEAHLVLGNLYMKEKKFPDARASFQKALNLNPDYSAAIYGMAQAYQNEGNWAAARAGFERLTQLDPRDSKAFFHLGDLALAEKKFDAALPLFKKATDLDAKQAGAHNRLGACYLELQDYEHAANEFRTALELNSGIPNAHFNTALIQEARGNLNEAVAEYKKELTLFPETYPAHFNLSRIYRKQGKLSEERDELRECVQQNPNYGVGYLYLAKNLMDTGQSLNEAENLVRQGLTKDVQPDQAVFGTYLLADILNRQGRETEARDTARRAQQMQRKLES
jgi:arylsulfatase A-like enzyme/Flp pilus assembly protein TadD